MADLPDTPAAHEPPADIAAPYALYVASMSERKRHDFLIDCWRAAREASAAAQSARLVLVGRPLPGFERFQDPAHQARLRGDGVIILNNCPQEQLAALYRHAAFTVYPSAAEGWGLPPVESLIAGTPCLVSAELPVARELASDGMRRLPADDAAAWTRALQDWLNSPDQLAGAAAQARAFTPPQWDDAAQIILAP
jgi:glycosyltransferase involved in cell wall biosynthesis